MYLDARSINRHSKTDVAKFTFPYTFSILFTSQYFPDKAWARDILCLRVKCKRNDRGCEWIGELGHAEVCNVLFSLFSCLVLRRQRGRVVRAPDLKSVGRGFKSRSDR